MKKQSCSLFNLKQKMIFCMAALYVSDVKLVAILDQDVPKGIECKRNSINTISLTFNSKNVPMCTQ